jgi:hypothetical protein
MKPTRTKVTVSKPRWGCWGTGDVVAVVHVQPSTRQKSAPISQPASDLRAIASSPSG